MSRTAVLIAVVLLSSGEVWAGADGFGLGNGHTGALIVTTPNSIINTYAQVTAAVTAGATTLTVGTPAGSGTTFAVGGYPDAGGPGDLVLVWQTTGYEGAVVSGSSATIDLTTDPAGSWELARVSAFVTGSLTVTGPLVHSYAANVTQVVSVREFTTLTIDTNDSITASPWDGTKGGIVAFLATGAITNDGSISVNGLGSRGGVVNALNITDYCGCTELDAPSDGGGATADLINKWAQKGEGVVPARFDPANGTTLLLTRGRGNIGDGAGGGDCDNAGGGGGGNGGPGGPGSTWVQDSPGSTENPNLCTNTAGSVGRPVGGLGGVPLIYSLVDHLTLGAGGGAGQANNDLGTGGAAGGGAIWIRAASVAGSASSAFSADGASAGDSQYDGAGGGGAGGSIYLRLTGTCTGTALNANGGNGGSTSASQAQGPGGGGGAGRILNESGIGSTCTSSVTSGVAGVWFNGAIDGGQDSSGPAVPQVDSGSDVVVSTTTSISAPSSGETLVTSTPSLSGTAELGSTVTVLDGQTVECVAATNDSTGAWSCTVSDDEALDGGLVTLTADTSDAIGESGTASITVSIDLVAPVISSPDPGEAVVSATPTLSGSAANGSSIAVTTATGTLCTASTSPTGSWSCPSSTLTPGAYTITATETDGLGNTLASAPVMFTVDTTAPVITGPDAGASLSTDTPVISGTAAPGDAVAVMEGTTVVCMTVAEGSSAATPGAWSCIAAPLTDGSHTIVAVDSDASSDTTSSTSVTFATGEVPPVITGPANGATIATATPFISGTAVDGSSIAVVADSATVCTVPVSDAGAWSCSSTPLANGTYTLTATSTDAQHTVLTSGPISLTVLVPSSSTTGSSSSSGSSSTGSSSSSSTSAAASSSGSGGESTSSMTAASASSSSGQSTSASSGSISSSGSTSSSSRSNSASGTTSGTSGPMTTASTSSGSSGTSGSGSHSTSSGGSGSHSSGSSASQTAGSGNSSGTGGGPPTTTFSLGGCGCQSGSSPDLLALLLAFIGSVSRSPRTRKRSSAGAVIPAG